MKSDRSPELVLRELVALTRGDELARLVHTLAFACADERRAALASGLAEAASRANITKDDAETTFGNVLTTLERAEAEGVGEAGRLLLASLLARGVALSPPTDPDAEAHVVEALLWIAAHTPVDALSALDAALGSRANGLWEAVARAVRRAERPGSGPALGRAEVLIGAAALRNSVSLVASAQASALGRESTDPVVRRLLGEGGTSPAPATGGGAAEEPATSLQGRLVAPPRGRLATAFLALTGLLFVIGLGRLVGRWVLRYRCDAELRISSEGATLITKSAILGRPLRTEESRYSREGLARATREVRYPRLATYAGLASLALGSYVGVSFLIDGLRAASPELLGVGAAVIFLGLALDYLLGSVLASTKGRCRVILVPRRGPTRAVGDLDLPASERALSRLLSV